MLRTAARSALTRGAPDSAVTYPGARSRSRRPRRRRLSSTSSALPKPGSQLLKRSTIWRRCTGGHDRRARQGRIALEQAGALFSMGTDPKRAVEVLEEAIGELGGGDRDLALELETQLIGFARQEPDLYSRLRACTPYGPCSPNLQALSRSCSRTLPPMQHAREKGGGSRSGRARPRRRTAGGALRSRLPLCGPGARLRRSTRFRLPSLRRGHRARASTRTDRAILHRILLPLRGRVPARFTLRGGG